MNPVGGIPPTGVEPGRNLRYGMASKRLQAQTSWPEPSRLLRCSPSCSFSPSGAVQAAEPKRGSYSGAMPAVADSVDADFPTRFAAHVAASGGYGATRFAPVFRPDRVAS